MKFYLAARYSRHPEMQGARDVLVGLGHEVTSRWIDQRGGSLLESIVQSKLNAQPAEYSRCAMTDVEDLWAADTVINFTSTDGGGKGGRHVEFGLALGMHKRIVVVGPRENAFHTLREVTWYPTWPSFVIGLQRGDLLDSYFRLMLRIDLDEDISACADDLVAQAYVAGGKRWERAYYEKQEQFAAETRRTSAMLQACGREAVPRAVVGEALLGYWTAQENIARAGQGPS